MGIEVLLKEKLIYGGIVSFVMDRDWVGLQANRSWLLEGLAWRAGYTDPWARWNRDASDRGLFRVLFLSEERKRSRGREIMGRMGLFAMHSRRIGVKR